MNISYSRPLELGWQRMKRALFQPFDLGRWMVLGFTAWLAQLADGSSGGSGGQEGVRFGDRFTRDGIRDSSDEAWFWLSDFVSNTMGLALVSLIVVGFLVLLVLVLWLSSRGRFMFLDNLIHSRTEVVDPWREFQTEGDSLFLWQIGYSVVAFLVVGSIMGGFLILFVPTIAFDLPTALGLPIAIGLGTTLFITVTVLAYIDYFLGYFVVPIMYKHRVSTTAAWGLFLPVLKSHIGSFVLFGLFFLAINIALGIAYAIGGFLTCCIGLLLMALPYLGAVITLPISVLSRFMNLEFLAQFGDDFNLLAPLPDPIRPRSGHIYTDGAVVGPENSGKDPGFGESGPQGP